MPRDRRWDFLYDREKQSIRSWLLERFADALAAELEPERPADPILRAALAAGRRDLARDWDGAEAAVAELPDADRAAARELTRALVDACLELKERAEGARLTRADLEGALRLAEARLFRVVG